MTKSKPNEISQAKNRILRKLHQAYDKRDKILDQARTDFEDAKLLAKTKEDIEQARKIHNEVVMKAHKDYEAIATQTAKALETTKSQWEQNRTKTELAYDFFANAYTEVILGFLCILLFPFIFIVYGIFPHDWIALAIFEPLGFLLLALGFGGGNQANV